MSGKRTVSVTIQGREYRIRADGDGGSVRRAAQLLDDMMSKVRERSTVADSVDIAVLAALNLANSLVNDRVGGVGPQALERRLAVLVQLAESALEPSAAAS